MSGSLGIMFENSQSAASKCSDVSITTSDSSSPFTVSLSTATAGAHIFYTVHDLAQNPVHIGDSAVSPTARIGSNNGSVVVSVSTSHTKWVSAVAYEPSHLDSNITSDSFDGPESGG